MTFTTINPGLGSLLVLTTIVQVCVFGVLDVRLGILFSLDTLVDDDEGIINQSMQIIITHCILSYPM
jgi:hypothetical protein